MRRTLFLLILLTGFLCLHAQWNPLVDYKMVQVCPPDPNGWDVSWGTEPGWQLGADWQCSETGPVDRIAWWYSWQADAQGLIAGWDVSIWTDVPAGVDLPYSHPGAQVWNEVFNVFDTTGPELGDQGWYEPSIPTTVPLDHNQYWRVIVEPTTPFVQTIDEIYWLVVTPLWEGGLPGWKTTVNPWNDWAVWWNAALPNWDDIIDPISVDLAFSIGNYGNVPVELSSFSASVTASNFVSIEWITQTETDMLGYNILRSETAEVSEALLVSDGLIPAQNQSIETSYQFIDQDVEMESTYWYWLESVEATSESDLHGPVSVTLAGGGDGGGDTPEVIYVTALENNYPNPFNPSTSIVYTLAEDSAVDVAVYNSRGQLVRMLHDSKPKGRHSIVWNGRDSAGADCASGVYYFHLNACGQTDIIKGILIK